MAARAYPLPAIRYHVGSITGYCAMNESATDLAALLAQSAPVARLYSATHCAATHCGKEGGKNCAWMHGSWQYLRLLGLVGSIERRAAFYHSALARCAARPQPLRVLLSGAADYAMLDIVATALHTHGIAAAITVLDTCATPLALNQWYAVRIGCEIKTVRSDILEYAAPAAFDAICTDSFLGRFTPDERPRLCAGWHDLLAPDGLLITDNRLREATAAACVGFTPAQAAAFGSAARQAAENMADRLDLAPAALAELALAYAEKHLTWSVRSTGELHDLFTQNGFAIDEMRVRHTGGDGTAATTITAPSMPQAGVPFVGVIARRQ